MRHRTERHQAAAERTLKDIRRKKARELFGKTTIED